MTSKRPLVYILTFLTYALIHSIRTANSYIKHDLHRAPLEFSPKFLGALDLTILATLSISLKTLGWIGESIGHKRFLIMGMSFLAILLLCSGFLQKEEYTEKWMYVVVYGLVGLASCPGWPSCLSVMIVLKIDPFGILPNQIKRPEAQPLEWLHRLR